VPGNWRIARQAFARPLKLTVVPTWHALRGENFATASREFALLIRAHTLSGIGARNEADCGPEDGERTTKVGATPKRLGGELSISLERRVTT
jgi:hypothetical protein